MKSFSKIHFDDWHVNPMLGDLALVAISGLMVAGAVMLVIVMLVSRY